MPNPLKNNLRLGYASQIEQIEHLKHQNRILEEQLQLEKFFRLVAEEDARKASQGTKNQTILTHDQRETLEMIGKSQGSMVFVIIDGKLSAKMAGDYLEIINLLWARKNRG